MTLIACAAIAVLLTACGQENRFIAPPPPKVTVELPVQQTVTPYLEATGNVASVNSYGYQTLKNVMFGPYQGSVAQSLYTTAAAG